MNDTVGQGQGEIILYKTEDGHAQVECRFADASIWLTQRLMTDLFQVTVPNINQHLKAIYEEGELLPERTIKQHLIVQPEGARQVRRQVCCSTSALQVFNIKDSSSICDNLRNLRMKRSDESADDAD